MDKAPTRGAVAHAPAGRPGIGTYGPPLRGLEPPALDRRAEDGGHRRATGVAVERAGVGGVPGGVPGRRSSSGPGLRGVPTAGLGLGSFSAGGRAVRTRVRALGRLRPPSRTYVRPPDDLRIRTPGRDRYISSARAPGPFSSPPIEARPGRAFTSLAAGTRKARSSRPASEMDVRIRMHGPKSVHQHRFFGQKFARRIAVADVELDRLLGILSDGDTDVIAVCLLGESPLELLLRRHKGTSRAGGVPEVVSAGGKSLGVSGSRPRRRRVTLLSGEAASDAGRVGCGSEEREAVPPDAGTPVQGDSSGRGGFAGAKTPQGVGVEAEGDPPFSGKEIQGVSLR